MIIPGTTAVLYPKMEQISIYLVDNILFTLSKTTSEITLQKRYKSDGSGDVKYISGRFCIPLTQEDTMLFAGLNFLYIQGQINFFGNASTKPVGKTKVEKRAVGATLATEIIEGNRPSLDQGDYFEMTISDAIFLDTSIDTIASNVALSQSAADQAELARDEAVAAKDTILNLGKLPTAEIPIANSNTLGGIKVGSNLLISTDGTLSVDTATVVQKDNTKPITSGAVFMEIGNIEALLNTI